MTLCSLRQVNIAVIHLAWLLYVNSWLGYEENIIKSVKNVDFSRAIILYNIIIKCILLKGDSIHLYKGIIYFMVLFTIKIKNILFYLEIIK